MSRIGKTKAAACVSALATALAATAGLAPVDARADSCWTHNGSLMRLVANGPARRFVYETPRPAIEAAGGRAGVWLFDGSKVGNRYVGTARVFNEQACPGSPAVYDVSGPATDTEIVLVGSRAVFAGCAPTSAVANDRLVFVYSHQC